MSNKAHTCTAASGLAGLAVCVAAALPYLPTLDDYFVRDDFGVVQLLAGKPGLYFPRWFVTSWMDDIWGYVPDEIRPFPALSYQLTALGGAASPVAHHMMNVALHAGNGLLVWAAARSIAGLSVPAALFAALAFVLLPVHAESVAWITGRVDSMPALFYLGAFLAYVQWRARGSAAAFAGSLALFFVALFTKQNAITMVATLVAYDMSFPARARGVRTWIPHVPFLVMTAGYLMLRDALFGEFAREGRLNAAALADFGRMTRHHVANVVAGDPTAGWAPVTAVLVLAGAMGLASLRAAGDARRSLRALIFFGPIWWLIGTAPVLVAGYESPRHVYLAAVGWAIVLGIAFEMIRLALDRAAWRRMAVFAGVLVLTLYTLRLRDGIEQWKTTSAVSRKAVYDLRTEVIAAPRSSLVIVDVPVRSWEWAIPFSLRPPFVPEDLSERSFVVSRNALHCCRAQWYEDTRRTLVAWSSTGRGPIIMLRWDEETGALARVSDAKQPDLRALMPILLEIDDSDTLDATIVKMVAHFTRQPA